MVLSPAVPAVARVIARYALSSLVTFVLVKSRWLRPAGVHPPRRR
jgi:hypothetical protein